MAKHIMSILGIVAVFAGVVFLLSAIIAENAITGTHGAVVAIALFIFGQMLWTDARRLS